MIEENNSRILIVDDDKIMAETLADVLEASDYDVTTVNSGQEAMEIVKKEKFDIGLLDIKMPGINGVEALKQIKKNLPEAFFAMMTAYSFSELIDEAKNEGAITVIHKPIDLDYLLHFIKEVSKKGVVVIIDDDDSFCESLSDVLSNSSGLNVFHAQTAEKGIELVSERSPDAVLLDMKLKETTGYEIFLEVKKALNLSLNSSKKSNIILMTAYGNEMNEIINKTLQLSAYACIHKPFELKTVSHLIHEVRHKKLAEKL
ncbi:MAG: response regulator [Candidatus Hodarchaeales archaeon]|jgi:DNA-binding NtrC family response regulator